MASWYFQFLIKLNLAFYFDEPFFEQFVFPKDLLMKIQLILWVGYEIGGF